jgi:hypothetical protein
MTHHADDERNIFGAASLDTKKGDSSLITRRLSQCNVFFFGKYFLAHALNCRRRYFFLKFGEFSNT